MSANRTVEVRGSTRHLPERLDYDYFCDSVADLYIGVRPDRPTGPFPADFTLFDFGDTQLGSLSTPGTPASRDRSALRRMPDDAIFLNYSRAPWTLEHLGREWSVPAGVPLLLDNASAFRIQFDPRRRMRLYSLRIPRTATSIDNVRSLDERLSTRAAGGHLAAQVALMADMVDADRADAARSMSDAVLSLLDALTETDATPSPHRLSAFKAACAERMGDSHFDAAALARLFRCSVRTVQLVFAAEGETFHEWITATRLELARERLGSADWIGHSVAQIAAASGFAEPSTFHRAYRRRFGRTPASSR